MKRSGHGICFLNMKGSRQQSSDVFEALIDAAAADLRSRSSRL